MPYRLIVRQHPFPIATIRTIDSCAPRGAAENETAGRLAGEMSADTGDRRAVGLRRCKWRATPRAGSGAGGKCQSYAGEVQTARAYLHLGSGRGGARILDEVARIYRTESVTAGTRAHPELRRATGRPCLFQRAFERRSGWTRRSMPSMPCTCWLSPRRLRRAWSGTCTLLTMRIDPLTSGRADGLALSTITPAGAISTGGILRQRWACSSTRWRRDGSSTSRSKSASLAGALAGPCAPWAACRKRWPCSASWSKIRIDGFVEEEIGECLLCRSGAAAPTSPGSKGYRP